MPLPNSNTPATPVPSALSNSPMDLGPSTVDTPPSPPIAPSPARPFTPRSPNPQSAICNPQSLYAHGLALFRTIFSLVFTLFNALTSYYQAHPEHDSLRTLTLALECLTALLSLEYTLHAAPERITPRQLLRLSKAARALTRLTGQTFDFSPWTSLSSEDLAHLDELYPSPVNPNAEWRPRLPELRLPSGGSSSTSLLLYPGATLANVIKKLSRILPPDFTPEAFTPALESSSPSPSQSISAPASPEFTGSHASHSSHSSHPSSSSSPSHSSQAASAILLADPYLSPSLKTQISTCNSASPSSPRSALRTPPPPHPPP